MSRIGKRLINIPSGVTVNVQPSTINVSGPKGNLIINYDSKKLKINQENQIIKVECLNEEKETRMLQGTTNALLSNAIFGVTQEFKKELILKGVGYKAKVEGSTLVLTLGYSHPVKLEIPKGIKVETPAATELNISGADKQVVGEFCAVIRAYRMPEPYKGKGILFKNEQIIRKVGKKADK